jgi:prepilin-type processing-associated H-X9-DG protein
MPIPFTCPHCGTPTDVADQYAGQRGLCVRCGRTVWVPLREGRSPFRGVAGPPKRGPGMGPTILIALAAFVCGVILATLLMLPVVGAPREAERRAQCFNNLRQIGLAMQRYHEKYHSFPPSFIPDENGKPKHSWRVLLLPFLGYEQLYSQYRFDEPWDSPHNMALAARMPATYCCPSVRAPDIAHTTYAMIVGPRAFSDGPTPRPKSDIKDAVSHTIMVVEAAGAGINWMEPRDLDVGKMSFQITYPGDESKASLVDISSAHPAVANVLFCDGSVRSLPKDTDPKLLEALTTIDGGETVNADDLR